MIEPSGQGKLSHYAHQLCQSLSRKALNEIVLVTAPEYELEGLDRAYELHQIYGPDPSKKNVRELFQLIRETKPDAIHWHWFPDDLSLRLPAIIKAISNVAVIYTAHNIVPHEMSFEEMSSFKKMYDEVDNVIVHSSYDKDNLINFLKVKKKKIRVMDYGNCLVFNDEKSLDKAQVDVEISDNDKRLLFFGYVNRSKGIDILIRAFKSLQSNHPHTKLIIAGKSTFDISEYKGLVKELEIDEKVIFDNDYLSPKKIKTYFEASDIVVLPHIGIGQSPNVMTANYFGKPVVATYPQWELIEDGRSGLLVDINDESGLEKAITTLLNDDEKLKNMGVRAKELSDTRFSWDRIADELEELMRETGA